MEATGRHHLGNRIWEISNWETGGRPANKRRNFGGNWEKTSGKPHLTTGRTHLVVKWKTTRQQGEKSWRQLGDNIWETTSGRHLRDNWDTTRRQAKDNWGCIKTRYLFKLPKITFSCFFTLIVFWAGNALAVLKCKPI